MAVSDVPSDVRRNIVSLRRQYPQMVASILTQKIDAGEEGFAGVRGRASYRDILGVILQHDTAYQRRPRFADDCGGWCEYDDGAGLRFNDE